MSEPLPTGGMSEAERLVRMLSGRTAADDTTAATRTSADEIVIGVLAVRRGLLDAAGLEAAVREQEAGRARGEPLTLGQVLIRKGAITEDDLTDLLDEQAGRPGAAFRHPRYAVRGIIGEGATSTVYRAWDRDLKREVAVKVLRESAAMSEVARERFRREAQAAGGLSHPGVVGVYDVGEAGGRFFIVLELVEGRSLAEAMKAPGPREPLARALLEAARGVAAAHAKGIVHRDLKPQNILPPVRAGRRSETSDSPTSEPPRSSSRAPGARSERPCTWRPSRCGETSRRSRRRPTSTRSGRFCTRSSRADPRTWARPSPISTPRSSERIRRRPIRARSACRSTWGRSP